nr:Gfo/Idh/MocA family oxidoreductase [Streptomyces aidingensis]
MTVPVSGGGDGGRTVGWGILATGGMAEAFAADLRQVPGARAVAVGSRTRESAERFAGRLGIPRAHGSWLDLARDPEVDVVYVATPHAAHRAAALLCLEQGRAVLCEKPLTLNLPQARDLVAAARERRVFLMEAMWTLVHPVIRRVRELVDQGAIGEVRSVQAEFGFAAEEDPGHRLFDPAAGGGALLDVGTYPVWFAHHLLGAPDEITAWSHPAKTGVDATTGMLLGYRGGAMAVLSCSVAAHHGQRAAVHGTAGWIEIRSDFYRPPGFVLHRPGREPEEVPGPPAQGNGYGHQAREVMRCLRQGRTESELVPLDGTLAVMGTLDEVRRQIGLRYPGEA